MQMDLCTVELIVVNASGVLEIDVCMTILVDLRYDTVECCKC